MVMTDDISTSAAVESSFKKLKTVTFKHISIPTDLENFLENHIKSLKGAALLRSSCNNIAISSDLGQIAVAVSPLPFRRGHFAVKSFRRRCFDVRPLRR
ncbi:unnamed protein product [Macrosiphum euphorbiae]|uniref:HAT C-terminal dimerisation domain-containing protein n=1 Tax=Macrosiphum euphorbiae TaxID=13131 RepID=A0AAV0VGL7_9HEMI|nr:unnamed protein product [Macrosiphum euphorbiae]